MRPARTLRCILAVVATIAMLGCEKARPDPVVRLKQVFASRPAVADADNAFLDVFGFLSPADADAHEMGARRVAWYEKSRADASSAGADPGAPAFGTQDQRSPLLSRIVDACRAALARACTSALERVDDKAPLSGIEALLLARYEVLLGRRGWYEIAVTDSLAPRVTYEGAIEAQRLMLIRLRSVAAAGDAAKVRATLGRDLAYWRRMLASSDTIFSKMIALAGVRQHFAFASYVLRDLPAQRVMDAIPEQWREEFTEGERSMLRPLAGELVLAEAKLAAGDEPGLRILDHDDKEEAKAPIERLLNRRSLPMARAPKLGDIADYYLAAAEGFRVPLSEYEDVSAKLGSKHKPSYMEWDVGQYALRVGSAEGMRRAALLTAELRSQSVPVAELPDRLQRSALRNPYSGQPFEWDAADQSIVFIGPESRKYKRQAYPY